MKPTVPFSDFSKLDLRVGTVKKVKSFKGTDNLLIIEVDLGEEETRKLVAGLAKNYKAKDLKGTQVVVVTNLEPREIRGVKSEGMLLAADCEDNYPVLVSPEKSVPAGTTVR